VLVPHLAGRARLVHEPPPERLVGRQLGAQDLERDLVALGLLDRAEDDSHRALAEPFLEAVGAEPVARFEIRHDREDSPPTPPRPGPVPGPCRDLVGCRYDDATMDDHTQTLAELAKRIASAKEFL
jgi:hypothetical protein